MYIGVISMRYAKALLAYATKRGQRILFMRKPEYWQIVSRESPNFDRHWIILYCLLKQS